MTTTRLTTGPLGGPGAGAALRRFADAIDARDWEGLRSLLAPGFTATLVHTGERLDRDGFVAHNADYPGTWRFVADEIVDAGERAVLRAHTTDGVETFHVACFASTAEESITDLVEVWTEAVAPHPTRRAPA